ncbi:aquaporin AQPAn.G-like isoform X2 [Wyeomyia smithii]|uniref:aquaporin AQPAn.G-like isoform X2 n=1 Tax=Wyeomyia smithii TaxID=174621 RepID=UPI002467AE20|nr:aquaporin AQPAn.G-like isoform X2 [Wyeomyia smithii]
MKNRLTAGHHQPNHYLCVCAHLQSSAVRTLAASESAFVNSKEMARGPGWNIFTKKSVNLNTEPRSGGKLQNGSFSIGKHQTSLWGTGHSLWDTICIFLAEFFGTAMLMFLGCMCTVAGFGNEPTNMSSGLGFGFTVMMVIIVFGCVSGAHINPSVSIAGYIYNQMTFPMLILYFIAQFSGGLVGYGLLMGITPAVFFSKALFFDRPICVTAPHNDLSAVDTFLLEFFITGILIWTNVGIWDPRNRKNSDSIPLKFAFIVGGISIAGGPYTGASMNPARTLAPAIWNSSYKMLWVYMVAPPLAGVVFTLIYKYVFRREVPEEEPLVRPVVLPDEITISTVDRNGV